MVIITAGDNNAIGKDNFIFDVEKQSYNAMGIATKNNNRISRSIQRIIVFNF